MPLHACVRSFAALGVAVFGCSAEDPARSGSTTWMSPAPAGGAGAPAPIVPVTPPPPPTQTAQPPIGGMGGAIAPAAGAPAAELPMCATGMLDADMDGARDCDDGCPQDLMKTQPGACGCGQPEPVPPATTCAMPMGEAGAPAIDPDLCVVKPITPELQEIHGEVYTRYASANGAPVLATDSPQDEALRRACMMLVDLGQVPEIHQTMLDENIGLVVMGEDETSADFPEFAAWGVPDSRARGLGGTPRGLCAEENVMCNTSFDRWRGESICVHEFAHTMQLGVYNVMDPTFMSRLSGIYRDAMDAGLYANTYAESNAVEYFAEGVQDWYDTNLEATPANGVHNSVNTRAELEEYDPALYALLAEVLPDQPGYVDCYNHE